MFKKYGYLIDRIEWPFVKLKRQLNCSAVFEDWLAIANAHNASQEPPHEIPLDLVPAAVYVEQFGTSRKMYQTMKSVKSVVINITSTLLDQTGNESPFHEYKSINL
ncbi:unnamed protein product [Toxocara canis]|uniref:DDE_Tnp_1_7 domain-containing protein n=1 Tax=Toxocara canis TaxID=6265 RepID=A0A183U3B8_TOXCA|nr:unnamed protein product [Toxocara canis]